MRFRKSIGLGKGLKLNVSKSGVSLSVGVKGASITLGKNGAYLNAGIPGTGLSERIKLGGITMGESIEQIQNTGFVPPYKTYGLGTSFLLILFGVLASIVGLFGLLGSILLVKDDPNVSPLTIVIFVPVFMIGIAFLVLFGNNSRKSRMNRLLEEKYNRDLADQYARAKKELQENDMAAQKHREYLLEEHARAQQELEENHQKILEAKINAIHEQEHFDDCKIFAIDYNNVIAFSEDRVIAICTEKNDDKLNIIGVAHITKITQEIKSGKCYAHIYTDFFENNVIDLFIGYASGKDGLEEVRAKYNEIKNLYTTLKKKKE